MLGWMEWVHWPTDWFVDWWLFSLDCLTDWLTVYLTGWLICWCVCYESSVRIHWLTDHLFVSLSYCLFLSCFESFYFVSIGYCLFSPSIFLSHWLPSQDANECDTEIRQLREHQVELSKSLEEKQVNCQTLQGNADTLDGDIEKMMELKQKVRTVLPEQGGHLWRRCQLYHEPTYSCSSLVESEPISNSKQKKYFCCIYSDRITTRSLQTKNVCTFSMF